MAFPTSTVLYVLKLLVKNPKSYALQLVTYSEGKLKRGSIYVILGRMLNDGLVVESEDQPDAQKKPSGHPRPKYEVTPKGERVLKDWDR